MKNFLRFFSLTTATQIALAVNQIVLLPLQLRLWGRDATAQWFVVIAIANLAYMADLGLRNAGHERLLTSARDDCEDAAHSFRETWALARALIVGFTAALIIGQIVFALIGGKPLSAWVYAVTAAYALETAVIVRGIWLDTLGHFNTVESVYLVFVISRVVLSFSALLIFHAQPAVIGWIMLGTSLAATVSQAVVLRHPKSLAFLAPGFRQLNWRSLEVVRYVAAEPAANWMRLSLPVIVLAVIAAPQFVATYVALRAVFGLARAVISQIARYASVRYVQIAGSNPQDSDRLIVRYVVVSTVFGMAISSLIIADRGRLFGLWLNGADPMVVSLIAVSFTVGAAAYGYQVVSSVMMRSGDVPGVARRQYAFLLAAAVAAVLARVFNSPVLYLLLLALEEILIAGLFVAAASPRVRRASIAAFASAAGLLGPFWLAARLNAGGWFSGHSLSAVALSLVLVGLMTSAMIFLGFAIDREWRPGSAGAIADNLGRVSRQDL